MARAVVALGALLVFLLCAFVSASDDVIVLTTSNFEEVVNPAPIILVEFYAPWCGHCKHLEPEYAKAATALKSNDPPVLLAKVDATVETELGTRYGVQGYPSLKIFRSGQESEYKGPRDAAGIISFMQKQAGSASKTLKTVADAEAFTTNLKDDVVLVAFYDSESNKGLANFRALADKLREEHVFGEVVSAEVSAHFKHKNQVVAFKKFDEKSAVFEGEVTTKNLEAFLLSHSVPRVGEFTNNNQKRYRASGLPVVTVYAADVGEGRSTKRTNYYLRRLEKVEEAFGGKAVFAVADLSALPADLSTPGVKEHVVIQDLKNERYYKSESAFNVENLSKFVGDYLAGRVKPHMKSEPVPVPNDGPVKVVVGETFNELVLNNDKDVFIEFYAPWCGHCKTLAPIWEKLGEKVKDVDSLVIAKLDATANDYAKGKFDVKGFPTIYLKKASGEILKYEGGREVAPFVSYLEKTVTHKFSLPGDHEEKSEKKKGKKKQKDDL